MPTVSASKGGNYKNPTVGNHPALCFAVVALGLQKREYMGIEKEPKPHVRIGFELCDEDDVNEDGSRMTIWTKKLLSDLGDKANLRHLLDSWRGVAFTPAQLEKFDLNNVLGAACFINVVHTTSKEGKKTYANIDTVTPLHKSVPKPRPGRKPFAYEIEEGPSEVFKALPQFIQKEIFESFEAVGGQHKWPGAGGKSSEQRENATQAGGATGFDDSNNDDEVPF